MEIIAKVSRGSKMDQVYIPQKREGFALGSYVIIKSLDLKMIKTIGIKKKITEKLYFYNIKEIEPIKVEIAKKIIKIIEENNDSENIIITGSFLDKGFNFNDIDILIINKTKINIGHIRSKIEKNIGTNTHLILLNKEELIKGLSSDPLYQMMLSRYIAKKRFIYHAKQKINYKILDLHLLKSKTLIDNFEFLNGNEKYYLTRNMISILLFLQNKKITKEIVDKETEQLFKIKVERIKQNILEKDKFLKKYKTLYNEIFNKIMENIKNGSEQK